MENLLFATIVIILLPHLTLSASSTDKPPEKFYVNCGSDSNVTYGGRTFVGDMSSGGNSVSFTNERTEATNLSGSSSASDIYRTVRIFRRSSTYKFQLDSVGLHFVRLHFSVDSSRADLLAARFTVSATSGSNHHFKSFLLDNFSENPRVEEFLLMMNSMDFEILFEPQRSSLAFINAIEVFPARNDLSNLADSDKNLHTIYRLNVGGEKITPDNDTLGRTWLIDDDFLYRKDSTTNIKSPQEPNYDEEGSVSATRLTAPNFIYKTAKAINFNSSKRGDTLMNVTWSFKVKKDSKHFIRAHFSDILTKSQNSDDSDFYLYVNGRQKIDINPSRLNRLATPFYINAVDVSDGSGLFNVSIGNKKIRTEAGFLNGVEVMEFLTSSSDGSSSSSRVYIIVGCVVAAAALILVLSLLFILFLKKKRLKRKTKPDEELTVWSRLPQSYRGGGSSENRSFFPDNNNSPLRNIQLGLKIPFTDILKATNNFDEQWLIGRGGFGDVYKAVLPDGTKAAIKRGKAGSGQGIQEFQTEVQVLSRIRHKHLVSLTGYCEENSEMILVYEFMEKGTLKEHLYGSDLPSLTWKQRIEICIGAARGLHYLHNGSEGAIIHRDIKSTNILLDEHTVAKVADFGLSKLAVQDPSNVSTNIKGTFGYLDPEYLQTHNLTLKSDVYAFGVVLLEVLCARPAIDGSLPHEEVNLAERALFCKSKGIIDEIVDPKLIGQIEPSSLRKFMEIAEKCLKENGDERPSMAHVMWDLEYVLELQMMTVRREPQDDSFVTISDDSSFVIPRLMVSDSFSTNSIVHKSSHGGTDSSESRVFSQLKISEAR